MRSVELTIDEAFAALKSERCLMLLAEQVRNPEIFTVTAGPGGSIHVDVSPIGLAGIFLTIVMHVVFGITSDEAAGIMDARQRAAFEQLLGDLDLGE